LQSLRAAIVEGFGEAKRAGLRKELLVTIEAQVLFDFIHAWYHDRARYGTTPSLEMVAERFPQIDLPAKTEYPLPTLVTLLMEKKLERQMILQLPEIQDMAQIDAVQARSMLERLLTDLTPVSGMRSVDLAEAAHDHIRREMTLIGDKRGLIGVPWPWEPLNVGTQGAQQGKTSIVYAPPKTGKTLFCMDACAYFFGYHNARLAVFVGKEMQVEETLTILSCMLGKIDLERYWKGELTVEERERFLTLLEKMAAEVDNPSLRSRLRIYEHEGIDLSEVDAAIVEYRPDIVYYDALYAAAEDLQHGHQAQLIADAVDIGARRKIHFLASWQAHIREAKLSGMEDQSDYAYTQNLMAKPHLTIKLRRPARGNYMTVGVPAIRGLPVAPFRINYKPGVDMGLADNQNLSSDEEDAVEESPAKKKKKDTLW